MSDEYNLQRFTDAQDPIYDDALSILRQGMMCRPYLDFIFPRLVTKGYDPIVEPYAIRSRDEASAYLSLPILGGRYRECIGTLAHLSQASAREVFGVDDASKLHASLTLFSEASNYEFLLETMFDVWFDGLLDQRHQSLPPTAKR